MEEIIHIRGVVSLCFWNGKIHFTDLYLEADIMITE